MSEKKWSPEQREAAAKRVVVLETSGPGFARSNPRMLAGLRETLAQQFAKEKTATTVGVSVAIDLQCELTAKEAELAEAVELLRGAMLRIGDNPPTAFSLKVDVWLERNTPHKEQPE